MAGKYNAFNPGASLNTTGAPKKITPKTTPIGASSGGKYNAFSAPTQQIKTTKTTKIATPKQPTVVQSTTTIKPKKTFKEKYLRFSERIGELGAQMDIGILKGLGQIAGTAQDFGELITKPLGRAIDRAMDMPEQEEVENIQDVTDRFAEKLDKSLGIEDKKFIDEVFEGLGSSIPYIAGGVTSKLLKAPAFIANLGLSGVEALVNAREDYKEIVDKGGDNAKVKALGSFVANLGTNYITNKLGFFGEKGKGISGAVKSFLATAIAETNQEGLQQIVSNVATGKPVFENYAKTLAVSAPISGLFGFAKVASDSAQKSKTKEAVKSLMNEIVANGGTTEDVVGVITEMTGQKIEDITPVVNEVAQESGLPLAQTIEETPKNPLEIAQKYVQLEEDFNAKRETLDPRSEEYSNTIKQINALRSAFNEYTNANKEVIFNLEAKNNQGGTIEVVKLDDNHWSIRTSVSTQNSGFSSPFGVSRFYSSREEAINAGKHEILKWVINEKIGASPSEKAQLNKIELALFGVDGKEVKDVVSKKDNTIKVGDVFNTNGVTNMKGKVTVTDITGRTVSFVDEDGQDFTGTQTSLIKRFLDEGAWTREGTETKDETYYDEILNQKIKAEKRLQLFDSKNKGTQYDAKQTRQRMKIIADIEFADIELKRLQEEKPKTQKEKVAEVIAETPKSIKEVAKLTGILEPNVRRILGVGAKDGTFQRVGEGVYVLSNDKGNYAYVEMGDAKDTLARMAKEGQKFDSVILDPAYFSRALIGGNRGIKQYNFIMPDDFAEVMKSVSEIVKTDDTHVYLMLSGARTAQADMEKYVKGATDAGFKAIGEGGYTKLTKDGRNVTNVRGKEASAERIILMTKSGMAREGEIPVELNFRFVRPSIAKSYSTEKAPELMKALILQSTLEGETVLDPFAGSGVTGDEALKSGRNVVLVEKQQDTVEGFTKPRVEQAVKDSFPEELRDLSEINAVEDDQGGIGGDRPRGRGEPRPERTELEIERERNLQIAELVDLRLLVETKTGTDAELAEAEKRIKQLEKTLGNFAPTEDENPFFMDRNKETVKFTKNLKPAQTPEEFEKRIEQLNKYAMSNRILRRTKGVGNPKASGVFSKGKDSLERGEVRLRDYVLSNPKDYVSVLAHELGHATEFALTGATNKKTLDVFGDNLSIETKKTLLKELRAVTFDLVGEEEVRSRPSYYNSPTELLARFFEKMFANPAGLADIAPTAVELIEKNSVKYPILREFLESAQGEIDKGLGKTKFLPDYRQSLQKWLGNRVGGRVWNELVVYRAMNERGKVTMERLIKQKFKGIKDDPAMLFRAVEGILKTENNEPIFGTRDFQYAKTDEEAVSLHEQGFETVFGEDGKPVQEMIDGEMHTRFAKDRFTPEEARSNYEQLSDSGKQLVRDFTSARDEAKDFFNREVLKDFYKINSNLEGWVHHYFEDDKKNVFGAGKRLKLRKAGARQQRKGAVGYVEDFQKAMQKAMVDLESERAYNDFAQRVFPMVTKPIQEGKDADIGWIEVQGNLKRGIGTRQETKMMVAKDGKMIVARQTRYQMPKEIYKKFELIKEIVDDASIAMRTVNSLNRYWQANILFHPGSAGTNFLSGGIQYGSKVLTDFYTEVLTGNLAMPKTRQNIFALFRTLTPKGWDEAQDWIYGGDLSNFYGQFSGKKGLFEGGIDKYADKTLKLYGAVERYWKKTISLAENVGSLENLVKIDKNGLKLPTEEERNIIAELNKEIDLFAYDYDNVPMWLETWSRSPGGALVKPFAKYPYKYTKQIANMIGAGFDRNLPWQERASKILTLATIASIFAWIRAKRREEQETPEGTENTPARLSPRGRFFIGKRDENELFIRTAKYPFVNLTEAGLLISEKEFESAGDILTDMFGSFAPVGEISLAILGRNNKYNLYTKKEVVIGDSLVSFVPGTRILNDIARMTDPFQRKKTSFKQSFTTLVPIPVDDESLRKKLRGEIRTERIPIEGQVDDTNKAGSKRTTIDVELKNYKRDVLLSLLTGIYITRINPDFAKAFIIREQKNQKKKADKLKKQLEK